MFFRLFYECHAILLSLKLRDRKKRNGILQKIPESHVDVNVNEKNFDYFTQPQDLGHIFQLSISAACRNISYQQGFTKQASNQY